jgi:hypothetical protein
MRLLQAEGSFKADMTIEPFSYSRLIADNMFEALVLLPKPPAEKMNSKG